MKKYIYASIVIAISIIAFLISNNMRSIPDGMVKIPSKFEGYVDIHSIKKTKDGLIEVNIVVNDSKILAQQNLIKSIPGSLVAKDFIDCQKK